MTTMTKSETVRGGEQSIAGTMRAVVIRGFGGPDVLEATDDVPPPAVPLAMLDLKPLAVPGAEAF